MITEASSILIKSLKCNHVENPLGVETLNPLLSWELVSEKKAQYQSSYQLLAASSPDLLTEGKADLWNTDFIESGCSSHIRYEGKQLKSFQKCYWMVRIKDKSSKLTAWSNPAFFEMGLLDESDWKARWICGSYNCTNMNSAEPAPLLRKSFRLDKRVKEARAYICGLGYHELYINGKKASDDVLTPAVAQYEKTVLYSTYDITSALNTGENAFGVILGNGQYNCFTDEVWNFRQAPWMHHPKLIFQAHIEFDDGEKTVITSDTSWKASTGPIIFDGLRNGEFYDARLEKDGWNMPDYCDAGWNNAMIAKSPGGRLKSSQLPPIKVHETIRPVSVKEVKPGVWVYDLGLNIAGWAQIKLSGPSGTEVVLKYAEKLCEDGSIDASNISHLVRSGEFQTDKYILKGTGTETWEPRFTYHGFQYVQVTGFPGTPTLDNLSGRTVHTAFEKRGSFKCSNELLNSIQDCALRSTLNNYHGVPTDCPQREKNGWTGDASLSAEQVLLNFNPETAYAKWMNDFKDVQRLNGQLPGIVPTGGWGFNWGSGPAWDSAMILIPWYIYLYRGDVSVLDEMYDSMSRYVDFMNSMSLDGIVDFGLGDWCPPIGTADAYKCPTAVTDTAYYYVDVLVLSKTAALLGKKDDSLRLARLAESIREAFRREFLDTSKGLVKGNCQTSTSCALYQGLVNEDEQETLFKKLVEQVEEANRHIDCGILGAKYVMHTLNDMGRADLAYAIATQTDFPGWGHWIAQGATTLWETWNGDASLNHHMFSDISAWFYKGLAGINPDPEAPGFRHIIFRPNPVTGLDWVNASHNSAYGQIVCNWKVTDSEFIIEVEIPVNCHATLYMPAKYSGKVINLDSGKYSFSSKE